MEVVKSNNFDKIKPESFVIALGSFDGLHLGHQTVINKTMERAAELDLPSGVYTFSPHPLKVINPAEAPSALMSRKQKINYLEKMGVDYFFEQIFTREFSRMDFVNFIKEILVGKLGVAHIVVGEDFKFGRGNRGNVEALEVLGSQYGFSTSGIDTIKLNSRRVSSTLIREMIKKGRVNLVQDFLGRYYRLDARVVPGEGRGRIMGFPTANLELMTDYTLPPNGVYAVYATYQGRRYKAIANFGVKPTFNSDNYSIEVHLFDLDQDLYGESISIELIEFLRKEMTFTSSDQLIDQIKKDILYTDSLLCYNN